MPTSGYLRANLRSAKAWNTLSDLLEKRERQAAEWKTKKDFERKFRENQALEWTDEMIGMLIG